MLETVGLGGPCHLWRLTPTWLGCRILYCDKKNKKTPLNTCNCQFWFISVHIQPLTNSFCLWQAAKLPMSIIIVGVGQAEFDGESRKQLQETCCTKLSFCLQFYSELLRLITENNGWYTNCSVKVYVGLFLLKCVFRRSHGWARWRWHQNFVSG